VVDRAAGRTGLAAGSDGIRSNYAARQHRSVVSQQADDLRAQPDGDGDVRRQERQQRRREGRLGEVHSAGSRGKRPAGLHDRDGRRAAGRVLQVADQGTSPRKEEDVHVEVALHERPFPRVRPGIPPVSEDLRSHPGQVQGHECGAEGSAQLRGAGRGVGRICPRFLQQSRGQKPNLLVICLIITECL
jgi:hypothetical protein